MLLMGRTDAPCCTWVALPPQLLYRVQCTVTNAELTRGFCAYLDAETGMQSSVATPYTYIRVVVFALS